MTKQRSVGGPRNGLGREPKNFRSVETQRLLREGLRVFHSFAGGKSMSASQKLNKKLVQQQGFSRMICGRLAIKIDRLSQLLEGTGITVGQFTDFALKMGIGHLGLYLHRIQMADPKAERNLERQLRKPSKGKMGSIPVHRLDIERTRYSNRVVACSCWQIIRNSAIPEERIEAWGILGVLMREQGRFSKSAFCFNKALAELDEESCDAQTSTLLRRVMFLVLENGDCAFAPALIDQMLAAALRTGDFSLMAKAMLIQGIYSATTGDLIAGRAAFENALDFCTDRSTKFGILQNLARLTFEQRAFMDAINFAEQAKALLEEGYADSFYLEWLIGEIYLEKGEPERSHWILSRAFLAYRTRVPIGDLALLGILDASTCLRLGQTQDAEDMLLRVEGLLTQARENAGVIALRVAIQGLLTKSKITSMALSRLYEDCHKVIKAVGRAR